MYLTLIMISILFVMASITELTTDNSPYVLAIYLALAGFLVVFAPVTKGKKRDMKKQRYYAV